MTPFERSRIADLVAATKRGDVEYVDQLLAQGVRPDVIDLASGWSALHAAVLSAPELLPALLEYSADPDRPMVMGGTPLSYVIHELAEKPSDDRRQKLVGALHVLLDAGANPSAGAPDQSAHELAHLYGLDEIKPLLVKGVARDAT
jgi:ankyrin repeat protein